MCSTIRNLSPLANFVLLMAVVVFLPKDAVGERLSIRQYGISAGLPNNRVVAIHQDAKGYLWFGTYEGLSRFDGYRFVNYSTRDGLGHSLINSIAEDGHGQIWVATNGGGVSLLLEHSYESTRFPNRESTTVDTRFVTFRLAESSGSNRVNKLVFDSAGNLFCGTDDGVYRAQADSLAAGAPLFQRLAVNATTAGSNGAGLCDQRGRVWLGSGSGLMEVAGDQIRRYDVKYFKGEVRAIAESSRGELFAAVGADVYEFISPPSVVEFGDWRKLPLHLSPGNGIDAMIADETGMLWIGTWRGLVKYLDGRASLNGPAQGLTEGKTRSLCQDREGNLWIGTWDLGVFKLASETIVSFAKAEGKINGNVAKLIEGRDGNIVASLDQGGLVQVIDGKIVPIPGAKRPPFDGVGGRILQCRDGDWWLATESGHGGGVFRFRESTLQFRHGERMLTAAAIGARYISCIQEDAQGHIWVTASNGSLYRSDPLRASPFSEQMTLEVPSTPQTHCRVRYMIDDLAGDLWIGDMYLLGKYCNGNLSLMEQTDGLPETDPRSFFIDHRGWLWIGLRYKGVSMTTEPAAEHPRFLNYSTQTGLASDTVWSITEDDAGRMYFGTERGLDRLDPATGRIRHFTTADGLAGDRVNHCMKDSNGHIWVATLDGISRLDPRAEPASSLAPSIYLSRVQIAGEDLPMAETGASSVSQIELSASRNNLLIQYTGIDFHDNHQLRYQYELEGVDTDWNAPTEERSVNYARLSPGHYKFLVRAVNPDGVASANPAVVTFRILPPFWARWWFFTPVSIGLTLVLYALYRYRVAHLVELERVRTRIATDLHDDIGSSLSRMAILSEVAKRRMESAEKESVLVLNEIAESARAVTASMSDIVWAIDPRRDDLSSVVFRVRQFASDLLVAKGIAWSLLAPPEFDKVKLNPQQRRHIFLIFKEAINNAARHADCHSVSLSLSIVQTRIIAEIGDDGCGFAIDSPHQQPSNGGGGHGLENIRIRAAQLGGSLIIDSAPGRGTSVRVDVPIKRGMA